MKARYQLLTAICGTVLQARRDGSKLAVFVVHEFRTDKTAVDKLRRNSEDYSSFLAALGISSGHIATEFLHGPVVIDEIECLVGKAVRNMLNTSP